MTKVQKISQSYTPFAGVYFVNDEFKRCGLPKLIDNCLGYRASTKEYSYSNIFRNLFNLYFSGGECMEDIHCHFRKTLEAIPGNKVPSPDTALRCLHELATENTVVVSEAGKNYQFNINEKLNGLNIDMLIALGELKKDQFYDFDYDNQIIEHEKYDAQKTYKMNTGYFPGIATAGNKIVYIENRDGNANVKTAQHETLERAYTLLENRGIRINSSRMDAGSYSRDIVEAVAKHSQNFFIRACKCASLTERTLQIPDSEWTTVEINFKTYQVASLPFTNFFADRGYRLVVAREKKADAQLDLFEGVKYGYFYILTNSHILTEKQVIEFYNRRGGSEKIFDIQNNDFGWNHLPTSQMNANTVYLILTAMMKNFYNYLILKISAVFTGILPTSRLKRFIFRFICVAGRYVFQGRRWILQLCTGRPYEKLSG